MNQNNCVVLDSLKRVLKVDKVILKWLFKGVLLVAEARFELTTYGL